MYIIELIFPDISPKKFSLAQYSVFETTEKFLASLFVALTAVFIYLIAAKLSNSVNYSLLMVFIFSFCTSTWSTASRGLWQHGPSMLMLSIALYLILLAQAKPWLIQFVSIPLAYSYVIRPTNSIPIMVLTVFVLLYHRKYFLSYLFWSLPVAVPFLAYNYYTRGELLTWYYQPKLIGTNVNFVNGLLGALFSPSRGLFVYTPVFIFSIYGIFIKLKTGRLNALKYSLAVIILLHSLLIGSWINWWGGSGTYGPRMFTDIVPFIIFLLVPVSDRLSRRQGLSTKILVSLFIICILASFFIHSRGATSGYVYAWNEYPVDIDKAPERIWNWRDIQFLRGYNMPFRE
jgi:hypothetical protein